MRKKSSLKSIIARISRIKMTFTQWRTLYSHRHWPGDGPFIHIIIYPVVQFIHILVYPMTDRKFTSSYTQWRTVYSYRHLPGDRQFIHIFVYPMTDRLYTSSFTLSMTLHFIYPKYNYNSILNVILGTEHSTVFLGWCAVKHLINKSINQVINPCSQSTRKWTWNVLLQRSTSKGPPTFTLCRNQSISFTPQHGRCN